MEILPVPSASNKEKVSVSSSISLWLKPVAVLVVARGSVSLVEDVEDDKRFVFLLLLVLLRRPFENDGRTWTISKSKKKDEIRKPTISSGFNFHTHRDFRNRNVPCLLISFAGRCMEMKLVLTWFDFSTWWSYYYYSAAVLVQFIRLTVPSSGLRYASFLSLPSLSTRPSTASAAVPVKCPVGAKWQIQNWTCDDWLVTHSIDRSRFVSLLCLTRSTL